MLERTGRVVNRSGSDTKKTSGYAACDATTNPTSNHPKLMRRMTASVQYTDAETSGITKLIHTNWSVSICK